MVKFQVVEEVFWGETPLLQAMFCADHGEIGAFCLFVYPHDKNHKRFFWLTLKEKLCHKLKCFFHSFGHCYHFSLLKLTSSKTGAVSYSSVFAWLITAPGTYTCLIIICWWNAFLMYQGLQSYLHQIPSGICLFKQNSLVEYEFISHLSTYPIHTLCTSPPTLAECSINNFIMKISPCPHVESSW